MDKIKVIIDTDIGDDADDALAICLALKSEELEVMGITTVFRNTAARAADCGKASAARWQDRHTGVAQD